MGKYKNKKRKWKNKKQQGGTAGTFDLSGIIEGFNNNNILTNLIGQSNVLNSGNTPFGSGDNFSNLLNIFLGQVNGNTGNPIPQDNITLSRGFTGFQNGGLPNVDSTVSREGGLSFSPVATFLANLSGRDVGDLAQLGLETRRHESGRNFGTSKEFQTRQLSGGPGRGAFQIEGPSVPTLAGKLERIYDELELPIPREVDQLKSGEIDDVTKISPQLQEDLFYAGFTQIRNGELKPTRSLERIDPNTLENRAQLWLNVHNRTKGDAAKDRKAKYLKDNSPEVDSTAIELTPEQRRGVKSRASAESNRINDTRKKLLSRIRKDDLKNTVNTLNTQDLISSQLEQGITPRVGETITARMGGMGSIKATSGKRYQTDKKQLGGLFQDQQELAEGNFLTPGDASTFSPLLLSDQQLQEMIVKQQREQEAQGNILQNGGLPISELGQFLVPNSTVVVPSKGRITTNGVAKPFMTIDSKNKMEILFPNTGEVRTEVGNIIEVPMEVKEKTLKTRRLGKNAK